MQLSIRGLNTVVFWESKAQGPCTFSLQQKGERVPSPLFHLHRGSTIARLCPLSRFLAKGMGAANSQGRRGSGMYAETILFELVLEVGDDLCKWSLFCDQM